MKPVAGCCSRSARHSASRFRTSWLKVGTAAGHYNPMYTRHHLTRTNHFQLKQTIETANPDSCSLFTNMTLALIHSGPYSTLQCAAFCNREWTSDALGRPDGPRSGNCILPTAVRQAIAGGLQMEIEIWKDEIIDWCDRL